MQRHESLYDHSARDNPSGKAGEKEEHHMATKRSEGRFSIFAMPLVADRAGAVRRMREEVLGARRREYEEARRLGITEERAWIQSTPM
jgi:hypothetical protein